MASRDLNQLSRAVEGSAYELLKSAQAAKFEILIYCTRRSLQEQARLYRQGRSSYEISQKAGELRQIHNRPDLAQIIADVGPQYGPKVTNAAPGQSAHNYGLAFDAVPMRNSKPVWGNKDPADLKLWHLYGELGEAAGLEWSGAWVSFKEFPHMQAPGFNWREAIKNN